MRKFIFVFLLVVTSVVQAQITKEIFESFKLQERRDVQYYFPENYSEEKKYPIIVVLDADYLFDVVVANAKFYSQQDLMPESIVVGIHQKENNLRKEDCAFDEATGMPVEKAVRFYEFIGMEILAYLETQYSTAPFKMLVGYDITANFGNYFLFKDRSLFNSYISISPTLAPQMESNVPARLQELDQQIFYNIVLEKGKSKYRQQVLQMNTSISAITHDNIHYFFDEYEDADHTSIAVYGISKAFDNVFKTYRPISPKEYKKEILTSNEPVFKYLKDKYDMIEQLFGYRKKVELNDIMAVYAGSLKKEDFESLEPLADLCKAQFPETMLGFYLEGEYYEQLGEPKKAMKAFEKAFMLEEIDFLTKDMAYEKINAIKADFGY